MLSAVMKNFRRTSRRKAKPLLTLKYSDRANNPISLLKNSLTKNIDIYS
jgi:hypothetical protein